MAKITVQNTEIIHNPNFNYGEFATIRNAAGQMQVLEGNNDRKLLK